MTYPTDYQDLKDHRIGPDGRYLVVGRLGEVSTADRGGWSDVYLARDLALGERRVVVKFLRSDLAHDESLARRFEREIRRQVEAGLVHTNVVRVLDAGAYRGRTYCILEHMSGGSLESRLTRADARADGSPVRRPMMQTGQGVSEWLTPIAAALDAIHRQGVVHRDVKPANILFNGGGTAFVSDFGIAKAAMGGAVEEATATGVSLYTPGYESPEMARGQKAVYACDRYALSVVVYRALSGRLPHATDATRSDRDRWAALRYRRATEPAEPLRVVAPHVSVRVAEVVMRGLAPSPASRPKSCEAFARSFGAAVASAAREGTHEPSIPADGAMDIEVIEVGPEPSRPVPRDTRPAAPPLRSDEDPAHRAFSVGPTRMALVRAAVAAMTSLSAMVAVAIVGPVRSERTLVVVVILVAAAIAVAVAHGLQWVRVDEQGVVSRRWTGERAIAWPEIAGVRKSVDERNGRVRYHVVGPDGVRPIEIGPTVRDAAQVARQVAERTRLLGIW